jgi:hypothetical protein
VLLRTLLFGFTSQSSRLASVETTLAVLALVQPLPRRMQVFIDRRLYRRKYDAAKAFDRRLPERVPGQRGSQICSVRLKRGGAENLLTL